ncbi:hypothetical protein KW798_00015 [Candidatus Parcubacteria bacterium]|nr:hypothetical protein [Candidatus Parcubacteria bacterium]
MSKQIVENLIRGSQTIDRVKMEIEMVLGMVDSQVKEEDWTKLDNDIDEHLFPSAYGTWRVVPLWGHEGYHLLVQFSGTAPGLRYVRSTKTLQRPMYSEQRSAVLTHAALPEFIAGMTKLIPELTERLEPIIEAATYQG